LIFIGDVHGCYETLMALFEKLPKDDNDIVFLGDLVDKGSDSKRVLDFIIKNGYKSVMGNHDYLMGEFALPYFEHKLDKNHFWLTYTYGGEPTINNYVDDLSTLKRDVEWIRSLPVFLEPDIRDDKGRKVFVTHGFGLPYYSRRYLAAQNEDIKKAIFGNRLKSPFQEDWEDFLSYKDVINIFGHVALPEVLKKDNYIGIDTGCVYGYTEGIYKGGLSALQLPSMRFFFQENIEKGERF